MKYTILFSPALVLLAMTVVVAINDGITSEALTAFLGLLTVAVVSAECVRFELRKRM